MTIGDQTDVMNRIDSSLPPWFGNSETPVLDGLIAAFSWSGSFNYNQLAYVQLQTRIRTATDTNLEIIAQDYFGVNNFNRNPGESDTSYRNRILLNILRERATRLGMSRVLFDLTGNTPIIFEPQRTADTGSYGTRGSYSGCGAAYGVAGRYGSILVSIQAFVTAFLSATGTLANIAGYNISTGAYSTASWGAYANPSLILSPTSLTQVYEAVDSVKVGGTLVWVRVIAT